MDVSELLIDAFTRIRDEIPGVLDGLDEAALTWRPGPDANTIGWLVWHLARVQDDHIAEVAGQPQAWIEAGWVERFGLPFPPEAHGYGHSSEQVAQVRDVGAEQLAAYYADVAERSLGYLATLADSDFDRVVDDRWDPPVTLGARLVSVIGDISAHTGQAAYVRGMWERRAD
ncbi:MAG: mycothiol transferase [Marmoricola sp.]